MKILQSLLVGAQHSILVSGGVDCGGSKENAGFAIGVVNTGRVGRAEATSRSVETFEI